MNESTHLLPISRPFAEDYVRDDGAMDLELKRYLMSASGWRKIFGADAESAEGAIDATNREIAALSACAFADHLQSRGSAEKSVALAVDTRPTGPEIAAVVARVLLFKGIEVRYLGISPSPEIMAYARLAKLAGFVMITASHNPKGYNGFKLGFDNGGVVSASESQTLMTSFQQLARDGARSHSVLLGANSVAEAALLKLNEDSAAWKREALAAYLQLTREVVSGFAETEIQEEILRRIREGATRRSIGVVVDFNGSARTTSIDRSFLEGLGLKYRAINEKAGEIRHTIVPEGEALEPCRSFLEQTAREDADFLFGYVPDNDGDRGNIVYMDRSSGRAEILQSQQLFALSCLAELAYLEYMRRFARRSGGSHQKVAVVVNGPTSLRVDAIARLFDAFVFRSEVGEANVVNLARDSRKSGFTVRILGEGSNGGNITHPAAVRDPINTLTALLKLLLLATTEEGPGLFEIWCRRSSAAFKPDPFIEDILATLPAYVTTDAFEKGAIVELKSQDHAKLKIRYEEIFIHEWDEKRRLLEERFGIFTWEEVNYEGINEVHGFGPTYRSGKQRGGMKIVFKDAKGKMIAFIWMRGSGTEPVFRILADIASANPADEAWLLEWHRSMVERADEQALREAQTAALA